MADFTRFNKFMAEFMPLILRDEMQKREVMRWLEKSLKEYAAYGEEQRKGIQEGLRADIMRNLYNPEYFKGRNMPELAILNYIKQTSPELVSDIQAPMDMEQQMTQAGDALARLTKYRMAGEPPPEDILQRVSKFFGEKTLGEAASDIVKQKEAAAERGLRGGELDVSKALLPIRTKEVEAREEEIKIEKAGGKKKSDMQKDLENLEDDIDKLDQALVEPYKYGGRIEGKQIYINQIVDKTKKIKALKEKLGIEAEPEYQKLAEVLKQQGFKKEDLIKNDALILRLRQNGYSNWKLLELF